MADPDYTFTIPSLHDDVSLDCRIYHPRVIVSKPAPGTDSADKQQLPQQQISRLAIIAHPYAPLGGCYDDPVVLSLTDLLLQEGYVVGTFNFRGAGGSDGHTSWTGKGETEDFTSFVGLMVHYAYNLNAAIDSQKESHSEVYYSPAPLKLLFSGYSFGALILARLAPLATILARFSSAPLGTSGAEIILRARTLAKQTHRDIATLSRPSTSNIPEEESPRSPSSPGAASQRSRATTVTIGGEETDPAERKRRQSREKAVRHASAEFVREVMLPQRIKTHFRHSSSSGRLEKMEKSPDTSTASSNPSNSLLPSTSQSLGPFSSSPSLPDLSILLISPVLLPLTTLLAPPGISFPRLSVSSPSSSSEAPSASSALLSTPGTPTLILFGDQDTFTSGKKLSQWCEKLVTQSQTQIQPLPDSYLDSRPHARVSNSKTTPVVQWEQIPQAGHFWRERKGLMRVLLERVRLWCREVGAQ